MVSKISFQSNGEKKLDEFQIWTCDNSLGGGVWKYWIGSRWAPWPKKLGEQKGEFFRISHTYERLNWVSVLQTHGKAHFTDYPRGPSSRETPRPISRSPQTNSHGSRGSAPIQVNWTAGPSAHAFWTVKTCWLWIKQEPRWSKPLSPYTGWFGERWNPPVTPQPLWSHPTCVCEQC